MRFFGKVGELLKFGDVTHAEVYAQNMEGIDKMFENVFREWYFHFPSSYFYFLYVLDFTLNLTGDSALYDSSIERLFLCMLISWVC